MLSLVISEALFERHPDEPEGRLTTRRAAIVSTAGLARIAPRLDLGDASSLGQGAENSGERGRASVLAGACRGARRRRLPRSGPRRRRAGFILGSAADELDAELPVDALKAPKSRLQERAIATTGRRPAYRIVSSEGPDHDRHFVVEVSLDGRARLGEGRSRREAETGAAAALALEASPPERARPAPTRSPHEPRPPARAAHGRLQVVRRAHRGRVRSGHLARSSGPTAAARPTSPMRLRWALGEQGGRCAADAPRTSSSPAAPIRRAVGHGRREPRHRQRGPPAARSTTARSSWPAALPLGRERVPAQPPAHPAARPGRAAR